jgi:hypothetical protein
MAKISGVPECHHAYFGVFAIMSCSYLPDIFLSVALRKSCSLIELIHNILCIHIMMKIGVTLPHMGPQATRENIIKGMDVVGDMVAGAASHYCFDHTPFGGIVIPTLRRAVSRTSKGAVFSGRAYCYK